MSDGQIISLPNRSLLSHCYNIWPDGADDTSFATGWLQLPEIIISILFDSKEWNKVLMINNDPGLIHIKWKWSLNLTNQEFKSTKSRYWDEITCFVTVDICTVVNVKFLVPIKNLYGDLKVDYYFPVFPFFIIIFFNRFWIMV